jgi:CheY-like chemotaxis protein/HPt (histidine-containing phosphotransfer) domain-containing protein
MMGYNAETVTNGREAIGALKKSDYDLVFMDCHMPEMDGFEATAEIRRQESAARRTPIIAMTASALPEDRARCLSVGMDDYLTKPLDRRELRAVLERWLPGTQSKEIDAADGEVATGSSAVDSQALENLRVLGGTNQRFLSELIDIFLQESVERLSRLKEAVTKNEAEAVRRLAHTQRGASMNLGAQRLARLCDELETSNGSEPQAMLEMIDRIEREFVQVNRALESERFPSRKI